MKKLLFTLILILIIPPFIKAEDSKEIQFIYINGSNNNDTKMKNWFFNGMNKMHPNMINAFYSSIFINEKFLLNGKYSLSKNPEAYFWGDKSNKEIEALNSDLKFTKFFSPRLAQMVRSLLAHYLHDAIWVSHYRNMHPILEDLHKQVIENYSKNKSVVLFGYSAGAFITYEYMFNKLPDIDVIEYFKQYNKSNEFIEYIEENRQHNTCIDAIVDSGLAVYSAEGKLIPNMNTEDLKIKYLNLDKYTCNSCIPDGALKGIINFASPLVLFYSDISNPDYSLTYYNKLLYKYLLENRIFWLTVNYSDDPLGYPTTKNISYEDLKDKVDLKILPQGGFLYSKSDIKSRKTFLGAHTSYWDTSKKFSKAVVDAYEEGYTLYNDNDL